MDRKICRECSTEDAAKNRLIYAGHGQWVCRNELNCEHRKRRHDALIERTLLALAGNDPKPKYEGFSIGPIVVTDWYNGFRNTMSKDWGRWPFNAAELYEQAQEIDPWPGEIF